MNSVTLGPLQIPFFLIVIGLAVALYKVITSVVYRAVLPDKKDRIKTIDNVLFNGLFLAFFVWKLSPLIFQFDSVSTNPLALLYLPGGTGGLVAGGLGAAAYFMLFSRPVKPALFHLTGLLMLMILCWTALGFFISGGEGRATAPSFTLQDTEGHDYSLSDYRGQTVILNFWASWCPPCRAELPELNHFYENTNRDSAVFLSINMTASEEEPGRVPGLIKEKGITYPVLLDKTGRVADSYGIKSIPTTIVIDKEGMISTVRQGAVTEALLRGLTAE